MEEEQRHPQAPPSQPRGCRNNGTTTELTVDDIIENNVGSLGISQMLHVLLLSLARIFDSQITLVTVFSDTQPEWRCTRDTTVGRCPDNSATTLCTMKPGSWAWVEGKKSSIVSEWDLVCTRKLEAAAPASLFFLGCILGSAVHGRLADGYLGRKKTVLLTCLLTAAAAFLTSLSVNLYVYALLRFLSGFARAGIGVCSLVLATEVVGKRWRGQVGQLSFFFFAIGFLTLPAIAYPTRHSWRRLYRVLALPPLAYSLLVVPFLSESPRWLAVRGRKEEAMEVLERFAGRNGRKLPPNVTIIGSGGNEAAEVAWESLWSSWWAARRMILVMITGFGIGFMYYGIQLNVENLSFNLYLAVAVNGVMEIPAVFLGTVMLGLTGRRVLFSAAAVAAAAAALMCIPFGSASGKSWPQLAVEALGFMAASTAFDVLYIYCVELFPTSVRNQAVSVLRQACMVGAAIAPLLVVLGRVNPALLFAVFGASGFLSAAVPFWLPETRNSPLYQTLAQQAEEEEKLAVANP